jgi:hypothetical protein
MNNKKVKWHNDWQKEVSLYGNKVNKTFKKGETKPDGKVVDKDEEVVEVNEINELIRLVGLQKSVVDSKLDEIAEKRGYKDQAKLIYKAYRKQKEKVEEWKDPAKNYKDKYINFLGTGTGGTKYNTKGWINLVKDYNQRQWNNSSGTATDYTNLYTGSIYNTDTGNWIDKIEITEQEALKLITQTLNMIGKIKDTKFNTALTDTTITAPIFTGDIATNNVADVKTWFTTCQTHAKTLIESKKANRTEYSLGSDYAKKDKSGLKQVAFTKTQLDEMFSLLDFFYLNSAWLNQDKVKESLTEIEEEKELVVFPVKKGSDGQPKPYTEAQLHQWGVEGYWADSYANSTTATNFYGTDTDISKAVKVKVKNGLKGWSRVILNYFDKDKWAKFTSSFATTGTNDSPYRTLFDDLRSLNSNEAFQHGGTGTYDWTLFDFPDYIDEAEERMFELETEKDSIQSEIKDGRKDLLKAEKEYEQAKQDLKTKENEVDQAISQKVAELRKEVETKWKLKAGDNTTTLSFGSGTDANDNDRITLSEHCNFQRWIKIIRYLVNYDEAKSTGKTNEDNAYKASKDITNKVSQDFSAVAFYWTSITKGDGNEACKDDEERIAVIKEGKDQYKTNNLNWYHSKFVELEKLVKLEAIQVQIKNKLKVAIDKQTPQDNMKDWQNNLKEIEAGLEIAFTEEKINQWKAKKEDKDAFNNVASVNTLLKDSVIYDETTKKPKEDFITWLKGKDDKLTDLSNLIKEKEPKKVITLIHRYKYNKLADTKKKEYNNKFGFHKEKKGSDGKYLSEYTPTADELKDDSDFDTFLYEVAVGKIDLASLSKKQDEQETPPNPNQEETNNRSHFNKYKWWYIGIGVPLLLIIAGAVIFWDKIMNWWNGPTEEEELEKEPTDISDE